MQTTTRYERPIFLLFTILIPTLLVGCGLMLTREQAQQNVMATSDYRLCESVQIGIPLGQVRYPDIAYAEVNRRKLDCAPYASAHEQRLKLMMASLSAPQTTVNTTVNNNEAPYYTSPQLYAPQYMPPHIPSNPSRTTHCRPDYAGGMRCTSQ